MSQFYFDGLKCLIDRSSGSDCTSASRDASQAAAAAKKWTFGKNFSTFISIETKISFRKKIVLTSLFFQTRQLRNFFFAASVLSCLVKTYRMKKRKCQLTNTMSLELLIADLWGHSWLEQGFMRHSPFVWALRIKMWLG